MQNRRNKQKFERNIIIYNDTTFGNSVKLLLALPRVFFNCLLFRVPWDFKNILFELPNYYFGSLYRETGVSSIHRATVYYIIQFIASGFITRLIHQHGWVRIYKFKNPNDSRSRTLNKILYHIAIIKVGSTRDNL